MFVLHDSKRGFIDIPGTHTKWVKDQCKELRDYERVDSTQGFDEYEWNMVVCEPSHRLYYLWHHRYQTYRGTTNRGDTVRIGPNMECVSAVFCDWEMFLVWYLRGEVPEQGEWTYQDHWHVSGQRRLWRMDQRYQCAEHLLHGRPTDEPPKPPELPERYTEEQQNEVKKMYKTDHLLLVAHKVQTVKD